MGFAENFIAGYSHGIAAKNARERSQLEREQFEEAKKQHLDQLKLSMDEANLRRQEQTVREKLTLNAAQRLTPAPQPDLSHSAGMGPPEEQYFPPPEPPTTFDIGGQHFALPVVHQEEVARQALEQKRAEAGIKEETKTVRITKAIPELGLAAGDEVDPAELTARAHVYAGQTAVKAAGMRAATDKPHYMTMMDPATGARRQMIRHSDGSIEDLGPAPLNATTENRATAAQALIAQGGDIVQKLKDPNVASKLGPAMGRFNNLREFIGNPPPEFADLAGEIESFSLANMGVHGMRSVQGAEKIQKLLSGKHTPESLAAGVGGLLNFSRKFVTAAGVGPKVGQRKTFANGNVGEWDGQGWVHVGGK